MADLTAGSWQGSSVQSGAAHDSSVFAAISTTAFGTNAFLAHTGPGILYGVHVPTASSYGYVMLRDTSQVAISSGVVLTQATIDIATAGARFVQFNPPLRFYNGLNVEVTACDAKDGAVGSPSNWCASVLFDRLDE